MKTITIKINGMMCGQCEAHVNDAFRRAFNPRKVVSSHLKNTTTLTVEEDIDDERIRAALDGTGYIVEDITHEDAPAKKGLFARLFKK